MGYTMVLQQNEEVMGFQVPRSARSSRQAPSTDNSKALHLVSGDMQSLRPPRYFSDESQITSLPAASSSVQQEHARRLSPSGAEGRGQQTRLQQVIGAPRSLAEQLVSEGRQVLAAPWWKDAYRVDYRPKQLIFKFRQETGGIQLGIACKFHRRENDDGDMYQEQGSPRPVGHAGGLRPPFGFEHMYSPGCWEAVLKPRNTCNGRSRRSKQSRWKIVYDPQQQDLRVMSAKMVLGTLPLQLQVGVNHNFAARATGVSWQISSPWGVSGSGSPPSLSGGRMALRRKTVFPLVAGVDVRGAWAAEINLPEVHGSAATGQEAVTGLYVGRLSAWVERVEAIVTHIW
eukprot:TRINITY_DN8606_c0_g1_i1.p1 TRINITY_DN8606_c0_g1~~TRINITY_DN8606_c0_g1_i1.p1  ORF type:complete len:343 (-),score=56.71 TRINITY_DN8606_c0_g1_i1:1537-2565(-)